MNHQVDMREDPGMGHAVQHQHPGDTLAAQLGRGGEPGGTGQRACAADVD